MRTINVSEITELVEKLCIKSNYELPCDIRNSFVKGKEKEKSPLGREIFDEMLRNCDLAAEKQVPVCQDTGFATVFIEIGQDVHLTGGNFEQAVQEGVRRGYINGYLRKSIVSDPLERVNTDDNTPAVIHTQIVSGESIKIIVAPKGGGSENMSAVKMFTPAATKETIINWIAETVINAGSNPCPPVIVGVGLGGTVEKAAYLSKVALLRNVDKSNENPVYAEMEREIVKKINASGVGPQGLGGTVTALSCAIEPFACHIASLPCAVSIGCHVTRHAEGEI